MHIPALETERIDDGAAAVDPGQTPGDIVFLSAADTELASIAAAVGRLPADAPRFRLLNLAQLAHPMSTDVYADTVLARAKLVAVRAMGGVGYWLHGLERLRALARGGGPRTAVVPGEDRWDPALTEYSTVDEEGCRLLWRMCLAGGPTNADRAVQLMLHFIGAAERPGPPDVLPRAGWYRPGAGSVTLDAHAAEVQGRPVAPIVFYRSLIEGGATAPVDALVAALAAEGIAGVPVFVPSLKDREAEAAIEETFARLPPAIVLNATAFAVSRLDSESSGTILDWPGRPVLQVVFSGSNEEAWRKSARGFGPNDLTMNVALPEVDGRLLTRAVSFKAEMKRDARTECRILTYRPVPDRVGFVARLARAWVRLAETPAAARRIAIVLSNYPNREGRIANGVGLDTPESAARLVAAMRAAGYACDGFPATGAQLMALLLAGPTNALNGVRAGGARLPVAEYRRFFDALPQAARSAVTARWGAPDSDPHFADGAFRIAAHRFGNVVVGIQPARGYNIDPKGTFHDPDLVPPHCYLAFYAWLREEFGAHAMMQLGKHGNLEWLPGKALGLSAECWPEMALGPMPLIYPFIVNDPGEGSQAKRRSAAAIVDHLMPAMTRAETYGPLAEIETLIDEFAAAGADPRRRAYLRDEILSRSSAAGLDRDLGLKPGDDSTEALRALDSHICELKELQIRDGLHVLGAGPEGRQRVDTLVAIARVPRAGGRAQDASLHRAIAADLGLKGFDPLDCDLAADWMGPRPAALAAVSDAPWRTNGDTVERIEMLAQGAVMPGPVPGIHESSESEGQTWMAGTSPAMTLGEKSAAVLSWIKSELAPALDKSGPAEIDAVLTALDGRFVRPGPSGAPTRGRPEVLPTGRNFYSVDTRAVPTAAAWTLGRKAADALALRYFQDAGEWPRSIAMSAWGTSNMRTGGDDIAQVLALMGAEPVWETGTGRVTGFRVMSLSELGRPRIDVTLRISGMFRDAFPMQIDLIDSAMRAVAALEEPEEANPLRGSRTARIFGSRPGAYGAGLQTPIDEGIWATRADLADAFLAWSSYAYGSGVEGEGAREALVARLKDADAVLHNQDNREHDILDSDDYYQFQGGLAATVATLKGIAPRLYHGDHSRPEKPVVRSLGEEIARVVRGRAANPKWIAGMMRHGYKGAFEMAATVDYLFAFAATTDAVQDRHFDLLYDAYLGDAAVREFIAENNAPALLEMAARFREAIDRHLWRPASNSAYDSLSFLIAESREAAE
jgi:cobaltochelatase CobN